VADPGWMRHASGEVIDWVTTSGEVYGAAGSYVGYRYTTGAARLGWGVDSRRLGYVVPGGELERYDGY
jgi:hypothetical protein